MPPLLSQLHMQQEGLHATETNAETHLEAGVRGHPAPLPHPIADPQIPRPEEQANSHGLVPSNVSTTLDFRDRISLNLGSQGARGHFSRLGVAWRQSWASYGIGNHFSQVLTRIPTRPSFYSTASCLLPSGLVSYSDQTVVQGAALEGCCLVF